MQMHACFLILIYSYYNLQLYFQACLQYINECGFPEIREFGQEVFSKIKFDSLQTAKLSSITGIRFTMSDVEDQNISNN